MTNTGDAFPRGKPGGNTKRPKTVKPIKLKPIDKVDDLFKPSSNNNGKSAKKKTQNKKEEIPLELSEKPEILNYSQNENSDLACNLLTLNAITPGMLLLGSVCEIYDYRMVLSLAGGLRGTVSITDVCDGYSKELKDYSSTGPSGGEHAPPPMLQAMFQKGQLIQCRANETTVKEITVRKRASKLNKSNDSVISKEELHLTINPRLINSDLQSEESLITGMVISGAITSVEDKGYVVDLGLGPNIRAFLRNQDCADYERHCSPGYRLPLHQVLIFTVAEVKPGFVVLKLDTTVRKLTVDSLPMRCILPGLLIPLDVLETQKNGLVLQLSCSASETPILATAHWRYLPATIETYKVGKTLSATVIHIDPLTKTIAVSLSRHLRTLSAFMVGNKHNISSQHSARIIGTLFDDAPVLKLDVKRGVMFDLGNATSNSVEPLLFNKGFAKIAHLSDEKKTEIDANKFAVGKLHK